MLMRTVRVVSTHPASQGPFVVLNEADFDAAVHQLYEEAPVAEVHPSAPADPVSESPTPRRVARRKP